MSNNLVRRAAKDAGVPLWRIAKEIGVSEPTMTRRLREELPAAEQAKILEIIAKLSEGGAANG